MSHMSHMSRMPSQIPTLETADALKAWLHACYMAGRATMTYGAPGVGKSEIHAQFARDIGHALLEVRLSYFLPEMIGPVLYPKPAENRSIPLKPAIIGMIEDLHATTGKPVLVFLDEITTATSDTLKAALEFVLDKRIAGFAPACKFHVVAAGNSPEDTPEAIYLPATHRTRFLSVRFAPKAASFAKYLKVSHPTPLGAVVAKFIASGEGARLLNAGPAMDGIDPLPVPRSIVAALKATEGLFKSQATLASDAASNDICDIIWRSAVGEAFWSRLLAHISIAANSVDLASIIKAPRRAAIPTTPEATFSVLAELAQHTMDGGNSSKSLDALIDYSSRCNAESVRVWATTSSGLDSLFEALSNTIAGKRILKEHWGVADAHEAARAARG